MFFLLFSSIFILTIYGQRLGTGQSSSNAGGVLLRARGPAAVSIDLKHGRANHQGQLNTNSTPLVLYCHAVDARQVQSGPSRRRSGEPPVLAAKEIFFTHNGQPYNATLSQDNGNNGNGTLEIKQVHIGHAGQWTCHVRTRDHGNVNGEITVNLAPVVLSNSSMRIDDVQNERFKFEAGGVTVLRGEDAQLECPVFGYPKPEIHWKREGKNGQIDVQMDGDRVRVENGTLLIQNTTYDDDGTYTCKAVNAFSKRPSSGTVGSGGGGRRQLQQFTVSIEQRLRVKNELGWVLPLCIILVTLALLIIIIVLCEMRKRRKEQKQLLGNNGNGDEE